MAAEGSGDLQLIVIGKTGNGKSSICNTITGTEDFATGRSMASTTLSVQEKTVEITTGKHPSVHVQVVDTPDVSDPSYQNPKDEILNWKKMADTRRTVVLLAIRCDVRFTPEEYAIYQQIKKAWGSRDLKKRLIVVFTFGDRLDGGDIQKELNGAGKHLNKVKKQARSRYIVFDNKRKDRDQVNELVDRAMRLSDKLSTSHSCSSSVSPRR